MKQVIFLMRHAHIDTNACMIGRKDLDLSALGIEQASYWRERLKDIHFDAIYTSPLKRAIQTVEIIKQYQSYYKVEDLSEISLGLWDGMKKEEIREKYPLEWQRRGEDFYTIPALQGESFYEVERRVLPVFYQICHKEAKSIKNKAKHILIVTHQLVNRLILADILKREKTKLFDIPQDYACINQIEMDTQTHFLTKTDYFLPLL